MPTDPWKSLDRGKMVWMRIDRTTEENKNPKDDQEAAEDITPFWVSWKDIGANIEKIATEEDCIIDGRVHAFLVAQSHKH